MAAAEGAVIACHTKDEFDAQMAKAYEAGKLVRTRAAPIDHHLVPVMAQLICVDVLHLQQFYSL